MPERPDPGSWPDGHALRAKKKRALTRTPGPGGCGGARPAAAGGSAARAQRGGGKAAAAGALAARPLCTLLPWSPPPCERRRCLRLGSGGNRHEATEAPTPGAVGSGSPRGPTCRLPKTSPGSPAHLSMMPFMRMALFQSFRVDLPARCTNSFGLMTCWSYCRKHSGWGQDTAPHGLCAHPTFVGARRGGARDGAGRPHGAAGSLPTPHQGFSQRIR